jgi:transposase-like protein
MAGELAVTQETPLELFACPDPECFLFNHFGAGNLSVAERMGKNKGIRRLYCNHCHRRFSERQGSLMRRTKLPEDTVVRIMKCLTYGCSVEAAADICEVDVRSVGRLANLAGPRAEDFHRLQLEKLKQPPQVVELDELHAKVSRPPQGKKGGAERAGQRAGQRAGPGLLQSVAREVATGFMWPWR